MFKSILLADIAGVLHIIGRNTTADSLSMPTGHRIATLQ